MQEKFIIISKAPVQSYPLVISLASSAKEIGYEVEIVTQNISEDTKIFLVNMGIRISNIQNKISKNFILKGLHWYRFAKYANRKFLQSESNSKLWITGADTAICMGIKVLKKRKFYFQINELYDKFPFYLKRINKIANISYANIVPEINRASIFQVWFKLPQIPNILENKPYFQEKLISEGENIYKNHIGYILSQKEDNKIIILYQGYISRYDRDLSTLLFATRKRPDILVVLMGTNINSSLEHYKSINSSLYYIPSISAPYHLSITKYVDIGVLLYLPTSLNNIYCAPNKIWEYTKYGLALIGNSIIGLNTITSLSLGFQYDPNNDSVKDIDQKLNILITNIHSHRNNSFIFYKDYDFKEKLKNIIEK